MTVDWKRAGTGVSAGILLLAAAACGGSGETEDPIPAPNADRPAPQATVADQPAPVTSTTAVPPTTAAVTTTRPPVAATVAPSTTTAPTTATTATPPTTTPTTTTAPPSGTVIEMEITDGKLEGGARREAAPLGEEVTVRVSGNSADHVHVHGYDLFLHLEDGEGELAFVADIPGVFEIELEEAGIVLVQLEVS